MNIRNARPEDFDNIWPIFHEIVAAGETYAYEQTTEKADAYELWMVHPRQTFVAEENGQILGTYFIKTNQPGRGSHVCNCGYMVSSRAEGQGLATKMCIHSQDVARKMGYKAMQFNFVVESNERAIRLWQRLGFDVVGTIPWAFAHPELGYVAAHVMYKWLANR